MEDLRNQINELEKTVTDLQVASANKEFNLTLVDSKQLNTMLTLINKNYTWNSKNAALTVHVYDTLKLASGADELLKGKDGIQIPLKATIMTGLYNILLGIENTGIESARNVVRILTQVGKDVTDAMNTLAADNKQIQEMHAEIQQLEQKLIENETSEQIKEEA